MSCMQFSDRRFHGAYFPGSWSHSSGVVKYLIMRASKFIVLTFKCAGSNIGG